MVSERDDEGRVLRATLPQFPAAPAVPRSPFSERRFQAEGGLEIRPLSGPTIPIPANEDEDRLRRYEAWHARTNGSIPEFIVYEFLVFQKKQIEGIDFVFQHPQFGGRTEFGGFVLDFFLISRRAGWRVLGRRFHLLQAEDRARDLIVEGLLESRGIEVINLYDDDLLIRPDFVLALAWEGREVTERRPGAS